MQMAHVKEVQVQWEKKVKDMRKLQPHGRHDACQLQKKWWSKSAFFFLCSGDVFPMIAIYVFFVFFSCFNLIFNIIELATQRHSQRYVQLRLNG